MNTTRLLSFLFAFLFVLQGAGAQSPAPLKLVDFVLTPDHEDWNYKVNERATVQVSVLKFGVPLKGVSIDYETGPEMLPADKKGSVVLQNGTGTIDMGTSKQPGFRQLEVRTVLNGRTYSGEIKLAYSPERIIPTVSLPDDFLQFWNNAKEAASKIPMDAVVTYLPQQSTTSVDVYLVNLQNYKMGQRLYGYLCKPRGLANIPFYLSRPEPE